MGGTLAYFNCVTEFPDRLVSLISNVAGRLPADIAPDEALERIRNMTSEWDGRVGLSGADALSAPSGERPSSRTLTLALEWRSGTVRWYLGADCVVPRPDQSCLLVDGHRHELAQCARSAPVGSGWVPSTPPRGTLLEPVRCRCPRNLVDRYASLSSHHCVRGAWG